MTDRKKDPTREFLNSAKKLQIRAAKTQNRISQLRDMCTHVTRATTSDHKQTNSDERTGEDLKILLADETDRLEARYIDALRQIRKVERFINKLPSHTHRSLLELRYVNGLRWPEILAFCQQHGICASERHMYRLHGGALEAARKLWKEDSTND